MSADKLEDIDIIKDWLIKQPHLPQNIHDMLLKRFLHASNNSIEQAKNLIDLFYTIRSQAPEIFDKRDPCQIEIQEVIDNIDFIPLPMLNERGEKLYLNRILTNDPEKYNFVNGAKAFFMFADVRMIEDKELPSGEVPIFDMKNFTLRHITKIVLPVLKKYMLYTQEAHPIKLKEIHVLNTPPYVDRFLTLIRPFIKSEVLKMLHFHLPNSNTLFEYIPIDLLPEEMGGKAGKINDIKKYWVDKVLKNRDYLLDESRWKLDESKRPAENNNGKQVFGMQGSFRSLSID